MEIFVSNSERQKEKCELNQMCKERLWLLFLETQIPNLSSEGWKLVLKFRLCLHLDFLILFKHIISLSNFYNHALCEATVYQIKIKTCQFLFFFLISSFHNVAEVYPWLQRNFPMIDLSSYKLQLLIFSCLFVFFQLFIKYSQIWP